MCFLLIMFGHHYRLHFWQSFVSLSLELPVICVSEEENYVLFPIINVVLLCLQSSNHYINTVGRSVYMQPCIFA